MDFSETSNLKNTTFTLKKVEKNISIDSIAQKIKNLRKMPFHEVFIIIPMNLYDKIYSLLEIQNITVVGFVQQKDNTILMKVS